MLSETGITFISEFVLFDARHQKILFVI